MRTLKLEKISTNIIFAGVIFRAHAKKYVHKHDSFLSRYFKVVATKFTVKKT